MGNDPALSFPRFCDLVNSITEEAWRGPEEGDCDNETLEVQLFCSQMLRFDRMNCFFCSPWSAMLEMYARIETAVPHMSQQSVKTQDRLPADPVWLQDSWLAPWDTRSPLLLILSAVRLRVRRARREGGPGKRHLRGGVRRPRPQQPGPPGHQRNPRTRQQVRRENSPHWVAVLHAPLRARQVLAAASRGDRTAQTPEAQEHRSVPGIHQRERLHQDLHGAGARR